LTRSAPTGSRRRLYLDASALVKLVVEEPESPALRRYLAAPAVRATSILAAVEVPLALARRRGGDERAVALLTRVELLPLTDAVVERAGRLAPLRALDAIHLASALELGPLDAFVAYDRQLRERAQAAGLPVTAPE